MMGSSLIQRRSVWEKNGVMNKERGGTAQCDAANGRYFT
jgi:hypothetical protein